MCAGIALSALVDVHEGRSTADSPTGIMSVKDKETVLTVRIMDTISIRLSDLSPQCVSKVMDS